MTRTLKGVGRYVVVSRVQHRAGRVILADANCGLLLAAIGHGSGAQRVMGLMWREAGLVRVERTEPHVNYAGKVLHLAQARTTDRPAPET